MADKKATLIVFGYEDGSYEFANGEHAQEVMEWLNSAQSMSWIHRGQYTGRKMVVVPAPPEVKP
jgi:hypothetical protein